MPHYSYTQLVVFCAWQRKRSTGTLPNLPRWTRQFIVVAPNAAPLGWRRITRFPLPLRGWIMRGLLRLVNMCGLLLPRLAPLQQLRAYAAVNLLGSWLMWFWLYQQPNSAS